MLQSAGTVLLNLVPRSEPLLAKVAVQHEYVGFVVAGQVLRLAAGMVVQAEIDQGRRTVLEYLMSPVQRVMHEAARER